MIKAIITDVDGVIVGDKEGVNFPLPNKEVIKRLKEIKKSGIPVILCTGKSKHSIEKIIEAAELDNPHVSDSGALIFNSLHNEIIKEHVIDKPLVKKIFEICLQNNIYLEVHSAKGYFSQQDQVYELTNKRENILQQKPIIVKSLFDIVEATNIIKILAIVPDDSKKTPLENFLIPVHDDLHMVWSTVPFMLPAMARVITAKGVSKKQAAEEAMKYLNISFDDVLGIGDLPADWKFISLCKYAAVVGKADKEFEKNIKSKGKSNYFFATSVDENGFLDIIDYFIKPSF